MANPPPQEQNKTSLPICHFLSTIPLEIRLEIYKYLLVVHLQPPQYRPSQDHRPAKQPLLLPERPITINKKNNLSSSSSSSSEPPPDLPTTQTSNINTLKQTGPSSLLLHPSILATCRQIHFEALPTLYSLNTFLAHESNLTVSPSLFLPPPPPPPSQSSPAYSYLPSRSRAAPPVSVSVSVSVSPSIQSPRPNKHIHLIRKWRIRVRLDCGCPPWSARDLTRAFSGAEELTVYVYRAMFIGGVGVDVLRRFEGVRGVRRARILGCVSGFEGYVRWLEGSMMREVGEDEDEEGDRIDAEMGENWESAEVKERTGNEIENENEKEGNKDVFMVGGYRCADALERKRLTGWVY